MLKLFRSSDGYTFTHSVVTPTCQPIARIILLHGIQSHAGWYGQTMQRLAEAGYEVHFLDRRGSGWHTAHRGDTPSFQRLIDDVAEYIQQERWTRPWLPTHIAGISWGGKIALAIAAKHPGLIQWVSLLCPGLAPKIQPPFSRRLRILMASILRPTRTFDVPLNDPELFTASEHWRDFIRRDPQALHQATARFLLQSALLDRWLRRQYAKVRVPVLLMLAGQDAILNNAKTRALLAKLTLSPKIQIRDYPHAYHTLEFEDDPLWFSDWLRWLREI